MGARAALVPDTRRPSLRTLPLAIRVQRQRTRRSNIQDSLRYPEIPGVTDLKRGVRCALDLHRHIVTSPIDRLSPRLSMKLSAVESDCKAREEHPARGHLVDQAIQPVN